MGFIPPKTITLKSNLRIIALNSEKQISPSNSTFANQAVFYFAACCKLWSQLPAWNSDFEDYPIHS
jgi:hypothetical protein